MGRGGHRPEPIEDDPWDAARVGDSERYQGRRRASAARRRWLIVTVALGVVAAVSVALTWASSGAPPTTPADARSSQLPLDLGSLSPSTTPTVSIVSPVATSLASRPVQTSSAVAQFATITIEAEAGSPRVSLSGSAQIKADPAASGGQLVGKLGAWGEGQDPGALRVNGIRVPTTGVYRIAIYYTNTDKPGSTSATVSVSGAPSATVKFAGNRSCCGVKEVEVTLTAGEHTISFSNPDGMAPAVDKITVGRPA